MKTICIYHKNCFDGICAAFVVHKYLDSIDALSGAEFIPANYNDTQLMTSLQQDCYENANINDAYIIVDFSFPRNLMIQIANKAKSIIVLDHHKTVQAACEGLDFCHFDMNESGASLAWKYFFPDEVMPWLVKYIKDRDLWLFKEESSEEVNAYIQSFPMELSVYYRLEQELEDEDEFNDAVYAGKSINRYKQTMVEVICKNAAFDAFRYPIHNNTVPIVNTSLLFSEVGHELCKMYPKAPFAAYYYDRAKDGVRQWGLRSIGDFDVSAVAKQFGGGGHKNAAGFEQKLVEINNVTT